MTIRTDKTDGVATIELARPEKKNAITGAMYERLADAFVDAAADPAVRAVLLVGQPGVFTAGNDLEDFLQNAGGSKPPVALFMRALLDCDKPVVAAVTGAAIGIGTTLLLHCDFVYVGDNARFALPFVALGLVTEFGSSIVLPALMGNARTAEKVLLGDPFDVREALDCGIATAVLPAAEVVAHARRVALRFNDLPPQAVRETKRLLRRGRRAEIQETIDAENRIFAAQLDRLEAKEAFGAFLQKRKPDFSRLS